MKQLAQHSLWGIVVICLLQACSTQEPQLLIEESQLVSLMTELHIADSRMLLDSTAPDTLRVVILRKHDVTEAQLDETLRHLADNPEYMATIYTQVVDRIVEHSE